MAAKTGITPIGRVSYPHLFKAREFNGKTQRSVTLIFKKDDPEYKKLKKQIQAFAEREAGKKLNHPKWTWPWRDSTTRVSPEGERVAGYDDGTEFVSFRRDEDFGPIGIVGPNKAPAKPADEYGGCYGRAAFRPFVYKDYGNGPGVSLGLEAFQITGRGEPFGASAVDPDDVFGEVESDDEDFGDEEDFDEEIPF